MSFGKAADGLKRKYWEKILLQCHFVHNKRKHELPWDRTQDYGEIMMCLPNMTSKFITVGVTSPFLANVDILNAEASEQTRGQNEGNRTVCRMRGCCISLLVHSENRNLRLNSTD